MRSDILLADKAREISTGCWIRQEANILLKGPYGLKEEH